MGGLEAVEKLNIAKAKLLYDTIDSSGGYYASPVDPKVGPCRLTLSNPR
jgi:phosphoserine aminotransferase